MEASLTMCYSYVKDLAQQEEGNKDDKGKKKGGGSKLAQEPKFKAILAKLEDLYNRDMERAQRGQRTILASIEQAKVETVKEILAAVVIVANSMVVNVVLRECSIDTKGATIAT